MFKSVLGRGGMSEQENKVTAAETHTNSWRGGTMMGAAAEQNKLGCGRLIQMTHFFFLTTNGH